MFLQKELRKIAERIYGGRRMTRENQTIEWKESWRDEYLRWVSGFANSQGGVLVIGRSDRGKQYAPGAERCGPGPVSAAAAGSDLGFRAAARGQTFRSVPVKSEAIP
jgi:hypothetical protein